VAEKSPLLYLLRWPPVDGAQLKRDWYEYTLRIKHSIAIYSLSLQHKPTDQTNTGHPQLGWMIFPENGASQRA
jgi:hypothetical protein